MDSEITRLISSAIDGQLDEKEADRLRQLLSTTQGADDFLSLMEVHLSLAEQVAPVRSFSLEELQAIVDVENRFRDFGTREVDSYEDDRSVTARTSAGDRYSKTRNRWLGFAGGIAVSLLVILPAAWQYFVLGQNDVVEKGDNIQSSPPEGISSGVAARIVKKIDCVWDNDRWMVAPPVSFREGEHINLTSGLLVLEFDSGARVTLQGPANASPISGNALSLEAGGMTAMVPEQARGFTVHTSSGEIIDLGTEFGVIAAADGSVETHVFKGEVVSHLGRADDEEVTGMPLVEGEAQFVSSTGASQRSAALESRFLRLGFGLESAMSSLPPVDRGLILWLAADGRMQLDEKGRVMAWGDNPTSVNQEIEDAWQVHPPRRPQWSENAIQGKPGVEFGGRAILASEPIELGSDITAAAVFQLTPSRVPRTFANLQSKPGKQREPRPDLGLQLLNLYGPPHPVIQIERDLSLRARVHLGWDPNHRYDNDIGVIQSKPIVDDMPHVVLYSFDSSAKTASLYLDGALVSQIEDVPEFAATYTPRYIGNHPYRAYHGFPGHIGELMLHDVALSRSEVNELTKWLSNKYGIAVQALD